MIETFLNLLKEYGTFKFIKAKLPIKIEPVVVENDLGLKIKNYSEEKLTLIALEFTPKDIRQKLLTIFKPNPEIEGAQSLDDRMSMFNLKGYKASPKNLINIDPNKSITLDIKHNFKKSQLRGIGVVLRSINSYDDKDNRTKIIAVNFNNNKLNIESKRMEFMRYSSSRINYNYEALKKLKGKFDYDLDEIDMPTGIKYTKSKQKELVNKMKKLLSNNK